MIQYLGLLLVLLSWCGGFYLTRTWRGTHAMSLSEHAASAKEASKLFAIALIVGGGALYTWLVWWLVPHLQLTPVFTILLTITVLLMVVAALVPDTTGWQKLVHRRAAYAMAIGYLPLSYLIIQAHAVSSVARITGVGCMAYMIFGLALVATVKRARAKYLILQSLYIVAFQIVILAAAYVR